jgi:hypothetical protein
MYGRYWNCLQCGLIRDVVEQPQPQRMPVPVVEQERRAA